jgi:hypothetical protein
MEWVEGNRELIEAVAASLTIWTGAFAGYIITPEPILTHIAMSAAESVSILLPAHWTFTTPNPDDPDFIDIQVGTDEVSVSAYILPGKDIMEVTLSWARAHEFYTVREFIFNNGIQGYRIANEAEGVILFGYVWMGDVYVLSIEYRNSEWFEENYALTYAVGGTLNHRIDK